MPQDCVYVPSPCFRYVILVTLSMWEMAGP
ncbi:rCG41447 [Rattus norvegicus]|uniref:RCG41447 n=1 Tax=Rattus norvegicus TaxID=10116 RepID=A6IHE3_RAT|nr:rCG41447 [Rattus norvegicus]